MAIRPGGRPPMIKNDQMSNRRHELREREGGKKVNMAPPVHKCRVETCKKSERQLDIH